MLVDPAPLAAAPRAARRCGNIAPGKAAPPEGKRGEILSAQLDCEPVSADAVCHPDRDFDDE
ncbi:hypothetical protein GCM10011498_33630 [Amylibacter cionae]|uniref:Uncharacterized protein n=1 Tax=Neptunicoccus cionae TaxID=2035344 RepID=A0A916VSM7_9RHOB|nr:hypothetical protein GCM10011498_33630 [Amylibacter cionae]